VKREVFKMVDSEMQGLMDAIDAYFEKKDVEVESKFHITKLLSEQYWAEMTEEDDEGLDDDFEPEPELEETDDEVDGEEPTDDGIEEGDFEEEVPDTIPDLVVPKPPSKAHEAGMMKKLQQRKAGKLLTPKVKVR